MLLLTMPRWTGAEAATPDKGNRNWHPVGPRP